MDIKTLLSKDANELEKLSDKELQEYFAPYLQWIRPVKEEEKKERNNNRQKFDAGREAQRTLKMAEELAKKFGIKI